MGIWMTKSALPFSAICGVSKEMILLKQTLHIYFAHSLQCFFSQMQNPKRNHRQSFRQPTGRSCLGIGRKYCRPGTGVSMSRQKSWIQDFKDFILQVGIDFPVVESVHYSSNKSILCITQRPLLSRLPWFTYNIGNQKLSVELGRRKILTLRT